MIFVPPLGFLGMGIEHDPLKHTLSLSQCQYTVSVLECYKHSDCKPISTPMEPGVTLTKAMAPSFPEEVEYMKYVPYMAAVGSLQYLVWN